MSLKRIFIDVGLAIGFLGINFQEHKATIVNGGNITAYAITTKKLGEAIAKLLLNPTPWINKAVLLTTIAYKQNDILRLIQEKTGEKWTVEETTSARAIELGKQLAPGTPWLALSWLVRGCCIMIAMSIIRGVRVMMRRRWDWVGRIWRRLLRVSWPNLRLLASKCVATKIRNK